MTRTLPRARAGISLFFFTNGAMLAALLPRYPEVKATFGLSNTAFGLLVAVLPLASMAASALPARLIRRCGAQRVSLVGTVVLAGMMTLAGLAPSPWLFALAIGGYGFTDAIVDAAQNVHGVRVEDAYGRTIINSLHALWSLGSTLAGFVAALVAARHVPLSAHLAVSAVVVLALAALATWLGRLPEDVAEPDLPAGEIADAPQPQSTRLPRDALRLILPLVVLAIAGALIEDVAANWSALYLSQVVGASVGVAGLGYAVMLGSQFVGRLLGDPSTDRWGNVAVLRVGGAMIAVGGLLVVVAPWWPPVMVGYALAGYGCATVVPAAYAAAGRLPGLPEGAGITYVSWLMRIGFLATSPLIGLVSDLTSLRPALGLLLLAGVAIVALSPVVRRG